MRRNGNYVSGKSFLDFGSQASIPWAESEPFFGDLQRIRSILLTVVLSRPICPCPPDPTQAGALSLVLCFSRPNICEYCAPGRPPSVRDTKCMKKRAGGRRACLTIFHCRRIIFQRKQSKRV